MSKRPRPPSPPSPGSGEPDLLRDVRGALDADHPLAVLQLASSLLAALTPALSSPFEREPGPEVPSEAEVVDSFLDVDVPETSALLAVIAAFTRDDLLRRRVRREIADRAHPLPRWLAELGRAEPAGRTVEVVHVLRDGDNVLVGARLRGGAELTAVLYIDHNVGTAVKDAFVLPADMDSVVEQMTVVADDPDTEVRDIDPAAARARIAEAIERGAMTIPPLESDTWPACRPLVEWVTAMLPPGGSAYGQPEWDDDASAALTQRFLATERGAGFADEDGRNLLDSLMWFRTGYGFGDPQLWSPAAVEILFLDWIPRKIIDEGALLARMPDLLRAFIRFNHDDRGLRPELTAEVLAAVDDYEPHYQEIIRSAGGWLAVGRDLQQLARMHLAELGDLAGGADALDRLDTTPLPDEEFAWEGIPEDVRGRVGELLTLVDRCCGELLDVEYRTACRRFLARSVAADPSILRRRGRAETAAAAVCWVIGRVNELFVPTAVPHVQAKQLHAHFGVASSVQRSAAFVRALGGEVASYGVTLGSPDFLVADRRARLIETRDYFRAGLSERVGP
ncbi:MAG: DUF6398 domain-containing protein [Pseudonocardia sp.]